MSNDLDRHLACATIPPMSRLVFATAILMLWVAPGWAGDDPLVRARLLYNQRQFEAAVSAAEQARLTPARADLADLVAARAYLEQFRLSVMSADLTSAELFPQQCFRRRWIVPQFSPHLFQRRNIRSIPIPYRHRLGPLHELLRLDIPQIPATIPSP